MYDSCRTPRVAVLAAEAPLLGRPTLISCLTWQSAAAGLEACIFANVPGSGLRMLGALDSQGNTSHRGLGSGILGLRGEGNEDFFVKQLSFPQTQFT